MSVPFGSSIVDAYRILGPARILGPRDFINEAQDRSQILSFHIDGLSDADMIRGGKSLSEWPITSTGNTAVNLLPGATRSHSMPNVLEELTDNFRLTEDFMTWNQIVRDLNEGVGGGGMSFEQIKSDQAREEVRVATSLSNKLEADYFAEPNLTTMTGTAITSVDPMSLFVGINEYGGPTTVTGNIFDTDPAYPVSTGLPSGWTTLHGVNPTTSKWHRVWQIPYNDVGPTTSTATPAAHNLLTAFIKAIGLVQYRPILWKGAQSSTTNDARQNPEYMIPCSTNGDALVKTLCLSAQNHFRLSPQDPFYPNPTFAGIPFVSTPWMDKAAVYPTSGTTAPALGAGVTEADSTAASKGPRFPLVSRKWFRQFMHAKYYFHMWPAQTPDRQHDNVVIPISTLHQRMFLGRRKMAMIYPVANITGFGG